MMHKTMDGIIIGVRLKRRELQYSLVIYYPAIYHQRDKKTVLICWLRSNSFDADTIASQIHWLPLHVNS